VKLFYWPGTDAVKVVGNVDDDSVADVMTRDVIVFDDDVIKSCDDVASFIVFVTAEAAETSCRSKTVTTKIIIPDTGRSPGRVEGPAGCGHSKIARVCVLNWPLPLLTSV